MKKILFTVATLVLLASVSSCTEKEMEGRYAPKEKIQAVYQEQTSYYDGEVLYQEPKFKSEEWEWRKGLLDHIVYFEQNVYESPDGSEVSELEVLYTQLFTYDEDSRLVKSEVLGFVNLVAKYEYDGKYLKTVTVMENGDLLVSYQFNHVDKKIVSFDLTLGDDFADMDEKEMQQFQRVSPLRFVLNAEPAAKVAAATQVCAKRAAKAGSKGNTVLHFDMSWDGDNVARMAANYMGAVWQYDFVYDGKNNPFNNLFEVVNMVDNVPVPYMALSKSNVTKATVTETWDGESETETEEFIYTYNSKDYPTSKTTDETWERNRFVQTFYYEYE